MAGKHAFCLIVEPGLELGQGQRIEHLVQIGREGAFTHECSHDYYVLTEGWVDEWME